jgi:hypothetical protein
MTRKEIENLVLEYGDVQFDLCKIRVLPIDQDAEDLEKKGNEIFERIMYEWDKLLDVNAHHEHIRIMGTRLD